MAIVLQLLETIAGLLALGAIFMWGLPHLLYIREEPPLPDPGRDVPPEDNAWPPLAALLDRLHPPPTPERRQELKDQLEHERQAGEHASAAFSELTRLTPGPPQLYKALELASAGRGAEVDWSSDFDQILDELAAALARSAMVTPHGFEDWDFEYDTFRRTNGLRQVFALGVLRGQRRLAEGNDAGGLADLLLTHELALGLADTSLMHSTIGWGFAEWPLRAMVECTGPPPAATTDPTERWPGRWNAVQLDAWRAASIVLQERLSGPRLSIIGALRGCHEWARLVGDRPGEQRVDHRPWLCRQRSLFDDDRHTRMTFRRAAAEWLRQVERPVWERDLDAVRRVCRPPGGRGWYNRCGREALLREWDLVRDPVIARPETVIATMRLQAAIIALKVFQETHERLPREWSEVVAEGLLSDAPRDPRNGQPLDWDPHRGQIIVRRVSHYTVKADRPPPESLADMQAAFDSGEPMCEERVADDVWQLPFVGAGGGRQR